MSIEAGERAISWRLGRRATAVAQAARAVVRGVLDGILPPQCLTCDQTVGRHGQLCGACFARTGFITWPFCDRCATPVLHSGQLTPDQGCGPVCNTCLADPPVWMRARAALRYDDQARRLILPFKHADRLEITRPLARMMARAGAVLLGEAEIVIAVPLHRRRLLARRYNQAALLATELAHQSGITVMPDILVRNRPTPPLGQFGRKARAAAVDGAFDIRLNRSKALHGRRVLLVDDVLTTGATAGSCAQVLLKAGAARVDLLVASRVADRRHN